MRDRSIAAGTLCSVACTPLRVLVGRLPSIRAKCGLLCPLGPLGPVRTIVCFVSPALIQSSGLVYNTPYQPFDHKAATLDAARRLKHLQTPLFRSVDSAVVSKACTGLIWSLMITKFLSAFLKNLIPVQALDLDAIRQSILDDVEPPPNAFNGPACVWEGFEAIRSSVKRWKVKAREEGMEELVRLAFRQASCRPSQWNTCMGQSMDPWLRSKPSAC